MTVIVAFSGPLCATATTFPSMEYADDKYRRKDVFGVEGTTLIRPPV